MSRRQILFWAAVMLALAVLAILTGPPTCADLRGIENCPAVNPHGAR